jgi:hypothetical protein
MTRRHTWVPYAAATAGALLLLKGVLIVASNDGIGDTPVVVMYFGGLLVGLVAVVGLGLRQASVPARIAIGFGASVLFVMWIMGFGSILNPIVEAFSDAKVARDEVPVAVAGAVLLAVAGRVFVNDTSTDR